jgi:hypothetical protein
MPAEGHFKAHTLSLPKMLSVANAFKFEYFDHTVKRNSLTVESHLPDRDIRTDIE